MTLGLLIIFSYLMGSIPSGYILVKKLLNKDVREYGSGNIGATNVKRVAGKKIGTITAILDMLKAIVPVLLTQLLLYYNIVSLNRSLTLSCIAIAAILGHNYTIFLGFKGGKGVATSAAAFLCITPYAFIITAVVFYGLKIITSIVSIRSLTAGVTLFISTWLLGYDKYYVIAAFIACLLVFWRHKANIGRLLRGEEK